MSDLEDYKDAWIRTLSELTELQIHQEQQREIIIELYYSSYWDSDRLRYDTAGRMWAIVKERFNLTDEGPARISLNDHQLGD